MIRHAQESDVPGILEIYNESILYTTVVYEYTVHAVEERLHWFKEKQKDGFPILVYEENGQILGFATYGLFAAMPAFKYTIKDSIYVHKDYRRKYIGLNLLKELIKIANEAEYATIVAEIDDNNQGSKCLHEKLGFIQVGVIQNAGYKFGKWLNLAIYQYSLKGPEAPAET